MKILAQIKKLSLATIVIALAAGILFVAFPAKCIKYISLAVGIAFIATAVVGIIGYLIDKTSVFSLGTGIVLGIIGIIICARYRQVLSFIVIMIGIFVLAAGIVNLITGLRTLTKSKLFGLITVILSLAIIVFGAIAITRSRELTEALVQFIGVGLIIYAILDIVAFIEVKALVREAKNQVEATGDIETEGTVIEE